MYFLALVPRIGSLLSIISCSRSCRLLRGAWPAWLPMAWGHTCSYSRAERLRSKREHRPEGLPCNSGFYSQDRAFPQGSRGCGGLQGGSQTADPAARGCCGARADLGPAELLGSPQHPAPACLHLTCLTDWPRRPQNLLAPCLCHRIAPPASAQPRAAEGQAEVGLCQLRAVEHPHRVIKGGRGEAASPAEGGRMLGSGDGRGSARQPPEGTGGSEASGAALPARG